MLHTPFHERTACLNQMLAWRDWSGYAVADRYEPTHLREYFAVRNSAALFDLTPLFKYDIRGPHAEKLLGRMLVRDIRRCKIGQAHYTCWCDEHGDVLEDGVVLRLAADHFRLTAAHPNLRWLELLAVGMDVAITDVSADYGLLGVQGPLSRALLAHFVPEIADLPYFHHRPAQIAGQPVHLARTGYTGDLGYELWIPNAAALAVWDALVEVGDGYQLMPAGLAALDVARIEAGLLLIDVDYDSARYAWTSAQKSTPFDLNFGWMVPKASDDRPYVGRDALARIRQAGSRWGFMGIQINWQALDDLFIRHHLPTPHDVTVKRASIPIYQDGNWVGYATSSVYSPRLKAHIALATLKPEVAQPGTPLQIEVTADHRRWPVACTVQALPFFDPPRKRA